MSTPDAFDLASLPPGFLDPMPRRVGRPVARGRGLVDPAHGPTRPAPVSPLRVVARVLRWGFETLRCLLLVASDQLRRRGGLARTAVHIRRSFERMGGPAIKLGQQLSIRVDLLPQAVCQELGGLLDQIGAIPVEHAVERIEAATGRPLEEIFASFDPVPVGSASIASVYQGVLRTGQRVAVKVRRPEVRDQFTTDLTALDWYLTALEILAIVRPGQVKHLRTELRRMFTEELDFLREGRYQTLFRRALKKSRIRFASAPRVHHELSNEDVLVTDFAEGILLSDVLKARESGDPVALARLAELDIDPGKIGRRLFAICFWSTFENSFFHADPHPANILIRPGGNIVLIDFGACGTTSARSRRTQERTLRCLLDHDAEGMSEAMIESMQPLPRLDPRILRQKTREAAQTRILIFSDDRDPEWWEATTAKIWYDFFESARHLRIPVQMDMIRLLRSTLLYDSVAMRLRPSKPLRALRRYFKKFERRRRRRLEAKYRRARTYRALLQQVHDARKSAERTGYLVESTLGDPPVEFATASNKLSYVIGVATRTAITVFAIGTLGAVGLQLFRRDPSMRTGIPAGILLTTILPILLLAIRRILFKLREISPERPRRVGR